MAPMARQWCRYHSIHQDDPRHDYTYPTCELTLRPSTRREDWMVRVSPPLGRGEKLTPERRQLRARVAALTRWSREPDRRRQAAKGQAGLLARFERDVDPTGALAPDVRARMADAARRAHMGRLALARTK